MSVREATRAAFALLNPRDRRLLRVAMLLQALTSLLDLLGVLLIGLVGALAVTTIQSAPPPQVVTDFAGRLGLGDLSSQALVALLAGSAAVLLLSKSLISGFITRRVFVFLANRQALITARLAKELLARPLTFLQQRSSQVTAFALIQGPAAAALLILGQLVVVVAEVALLVALGFALLLIDPLVTLGATAFFALVGFILQRAMGEWASRLGREVAAADIASLNAIQEALSAYREVSVADRRELYVERVQALRWSAAQAGADRLFITQVPKYVFEAALVLGALALAGALFATDSASAAMGTLALFLAAATRVMPSLLRLQSATITMRDAAGVAEPTFALAAELGNPLDIATMPTDPVALRKRISRGYPDFSGGVELDDITVRYPGAQRDALAGVTVVVPPGTSLAVVGRSGAGKSTFADVVLGVLDPVTGTAAIDGVLARSATAKWPGGIAYVPQTVTIAQGTIRDNVALGLPREAVDDDAVWAALRRAHLADHLQQEREGLDTVVGEGGLLLSGGQRQRLGIARALYTRPRLLVLDEATSALDAETEQAIGETLRGLEGEVTLIVVAHRLSTVRHSDALLYLDEGRVEALGTFNEVRAQVPALERQAALMGL